MSLNCKNQEYQNCGPDLDGEYCLLHKPNKTEKESKRFYEEIKGKEDNQIKDKDSTRIVFGYELNWQGYVFPEIERCVNFFDKALFKSQVNLCDAVFEGPCLFNDAKFKDEAYLTDVVFKKGCSFSNANFEGDCYFNDSIFESKVSFLGATFEEKCDFQKNEVGTKFKDSVDFSQASFRGPVYFKGTKFGGNLKFRDTHFERGVKLDEDRNLYKKLQAWEEVSRILKQDYEKYGDKENVEKWFLRERRAIRNQKRQKKSIVSKTTAGIECLLVDWTSKYGTSWIRLFWVTGSLILLFSILYWISSQISWIGYIEGYSNDLLYSFGQSLYYSIVTFTTLGYGDMVPIGIEMKFLSALQTLLGAVFMALIVFVFARKYMR